MLKQNSKVLCIKSIKNFDKEIIYTKNKIYNIETVYSISLDDNDVQIYIKNDFGKTGTAFYTTYIYKYFIPLNEARKQKLDKLTQYENNI